MHWILLDTPSNQQHCLFHLIDEENLDNQLYIFCHPFIDYHNIISTHLCTLKYLIYDKELYLEMIHLFLQIKPWKIEFLQSRLRDRHLLF